MEKEPHPQLSASLYRMGMIPWSANPSTMTTPKSWPSLDDPSKMGNCQVSWPVYHGHIPLNHVGVRHLIMGWTMHYTIIGVESISKMKHQGPRWRTMGLWVAIHCNLADPGFVDAFEMMDKTSTLKTWGQSEWVIIRAGELDEDKVDDHDKDELWTKGAMTGQGTGEKLGERNWEKVMDLFDNGVEQCSNCLIEAGR
jgi:hypothetical protein